MIGSILSKGLDVLSSLATGGGVNGMVAELFGNGAGALKNLLGANSPLAASLGLAKNMAKLKENEFLFGKGM